jgi:hypothetical protein
MDGAYQSGIPAQGPVRPAPSFEAGQPDIQRPVSKPRRVGLIIFAIALGALAIAFFGPYLGGLVVASVTINWLSRLRDNRNQRQRSAAAAEQWRYDLLRRVDAIDRQPQPISEVLVARLRRARLRRPRPADERVFEVQPRWPMTPDDLRLKQIEASARTDELTTEEILEREG